MSGPTLETGSATEVKQWIDMYRRMLAIRMFEEHVNDLYTQALMPGLAHLYIGEEAVAVGVCSALRTDDYITSTHRGHGHCLAKGASPDRMFAELLGKEAGLLQGQRRIDAHRRPGHRQPGRQCHRGRQHSHRHRRGFLRQAPEEWPGGRLLLRRRRHGAGTALRGHEPGAALEAAGHLRLRKQSLQRVHPQLRVLRRQPAGPARRLRHARRKRGRAERARRLRGRQAARRARAPGRGSGVSCCAIPTAIAVTTSATSTASTIAPRTRSSAG